MSQSQADSLDEQFEDWCVQNDCDGVHRNGFKKQFLMRMSNTKLRVLCADNSLSMQDDKESLIQRLVSHGLPPDEWLDEFQVDNPVPNMTWLIERSHGHTMFLCDAEFNVLRDRWCSQVQCITVPVLVLDWCCLARKCRIFVLQKRIRYSDVFRIQYSGASARVRSRRDIMNSRCQSTAASRTVNDYYVFPDSSMQPKGDVIDVEMTSTPAAAPSPTAASPTAAAPGSPSTPAPLPGPLPSPASPKPAPSPRTVPTPVFDGDTEAEARWIDHVWGCESCGWLVLSLDNPILCGGVASCTGDMVPMLDEYAWSFKQVALY